MVRSVGMESEGVAFATTKKLFTAFLQLPFCYISLAHFTELQIALGTSPSTSIVHMLVDCLLGVGHEQKKEIFRFR